VHVIHAERGTVATSIFVNDLITLCFGVVERDLLRRALMRRRTFLGTGALALCGASLHAEAPAAALARAVGLARGDGRRKAELIAARVSFDRVIRTTVGLRPHRDSGFVLKAEQFDDKTVVHNYGHGGAGMSLAWGTGAMAADLALKHKERRAAVLGCGSPGLTAARQLQRRGFAVTIYTKTVPPDTTSNMSMASFTPTSGLVEAGRRTPAWDQQFHKAVDISYRQLQRLAGRDYGVYWIDSYAATDDPFAPRGSSDDGGLLGDRSRAGRDRETLGPGEHPFPTEYAIRTRSLNIEPSIYLDKLVEDFLTSGGRIIIRTFDSPRDLMDLPERVVVNSTGLGSLTLFNDQELVPVKGQLSLLLPQPEVQYRVGSRITGLDGESINVSMNPRSDGIVIGNLQERGSWSLEPLDDVRERNVTAAMRFFNAMRPIGRS
jgi:glycine/D-amino acid oxidase-like deaminating enzyme